jgi:hypothetical protein
MKRAGRVAQRADALGRSALQVDDIGLFAGIVNAGALIGRKFRKYAQTLMVRDVVVLTIRLYQFVTFRCLD